MQDIFKQIKELKKQASLEKDKEKKLALEKQIKALEPKPKSMFEVRVETLLPATITYRVLAEDAEQAVELAKKMPPSGIKHTLMGKRDIKLTVFIAGTSLIKLVKNLLR